MALNSPFEILGYHGCDLPVGVRILNGLEGLQPSTNNWDWLGHGVYFWEHNPQRALEYAKDVADGNLRNKTKVTRPFVLGAIVELGNCLNLTEPISVEILKLGYEFLLDMLETTGSSLPENTGNIRRLDCAVIQSIHQSRRNVGEPKFDTVRSVFFEGQTVYPNANFHSQNHIQICVINTKLIKGYFLPLPQSQYNPFL